MDTRAPEIFALFAAYDRGVAVVETDEDVAASSFLRGNAEHPEPLRFHRAHGARLADLLKATARDFHLLSPAASAALTQGSITGWRGSPVILDPTGLRGEPGGYVAMSVLGRCGPIDRTLGRSETRMSPAGRPYRVQVGITPETGGWDGTDMFMTSDEAISVIFVTDRVRRVVDDAGLTNFRFVPIEELDWS